MDKNCKIEDMPIRSFAPKEKGTKTNGFSGAEYLSDYIPMVFSLHHKTMSKEHY
jgi:hypothetical protein